MAEQLAEIETIAAEPGAAHVREHDRRAGARRPHARPRRERLRRLELDPEHARVPGGRARDGAEARRVPGPDHPERAALRAGSTRSTRRARPRGSRPSSSAWSGSTTTTSSAPARSSTPRGKAAARRDQPAPGHALHDASARTCSPTRTTTCSSSTSEADLAGLPDSVPLRRGGRRRGARAEGPVGDPQHPLERGAVPHLLRPARPARAGLADVLQPRRPRRRDGQQEDHHRDPEAARRAREAARLRDARALAHRGHDGQDARSAPWS